MNRAPITAIGAEKLKTELRKLKIQDRPKVIQAIADAREHGDLKENAEYHAAREQQSFIEGRIQELEGNLSTALIIKIEEVAERANGRIVFGATVNLEDIDTGENVTYQIVGDIEADIRQNLIAVSSPIARALIGKEVEDIATVNAPRGTKEYEIMAIQYV